MLGSILMIVFLVSFAIDRIQSKTKLWFLLTFAIISLLCALLTQINNQMARIVFAWISIIFPILVIFFLGGLLLGLAIVQGMNSISSLLFCLVLSSIIAFAGSILLITCSHQKIGIDR